MAARQADGSVYTHKNRKQLPRTVESFRFVTATDDTVAIDEDGIENHVRIDRVTRTSRNKPSKSFDLLILGVYWYLQSSMVFRFAQ